MYSHIINGHYMFGNTFIQPEMYRYNKIRHHYMAPAKRPMPPYPDMVNRPIQCPNAGAAGCCLAYEDNGTKVDAPYTDSNKDGANKCADCKDCPFSSDGIIRDPLLTNLVNIETSVVKTLKITLYGTSTEQDKTIEMKTGGRYAVTYITEHGLVTSVGYLELISDSVPDECTRYINTTNAAAVSTAYIGMDCSTEGHSDKRKIYISTIRSIQVLAEGEEPETPEVKSMRERLQSLLDAIEKGELVFCDDNCGVGTEEIKPSDPEDNYDDGDDGFDVEIIG